MKTLQFPMVLTHRTDPHAQIVVANAEQYADAPDEFKPQLTGGDVGTASPVVTAAAAILGVNLETATTAAAVVTEDAERRQSLDEAVDEFTAHVQAEEKRLAAIREEIERDRSELSQQVAALNDREQELARERAEFDAQRAAAAATGDTAGDTGAASAAAEGAATGETPAAPAKRTRTAAKEGA